MVINHVVSFSKKDEKLLAATNVNRKLPHTKAATCTGSQRSKG